MGLEANEQYRVKIVAVNVRGESPFSASVTHFAGAVPSGLASPTAVAGSRTVDTIGIAWTAPAASTTDVLGYRLFVNEPTSNAVPTEMVYDGSAIPNVYQARVGGLRSRETYWFAYQVLNRAGWSDLSWPYLKVVAGPLPSPPAAAPVPTQTSPTGISFKWDACPDESAAALLVNYYIYDGETQIATVDADTVSYDYTGVVAG